MYAVEFQTRITHDAIELPEAYRGRFSGQVRVIILAEELPSTPDMIAQLLSHPLEVENFVPLQREQIYERS